MRMHIRAMVCLLAVLALPACDDDIGPDDERFLSTMSGANELPNAIATPATGTAEFRVQDDGTIRYTVDVNGITGVTMAHIHGPADATRNAGIMIWLYPPGATAPATPSGALDGRLAEGTITPAQIPVGLDSLLVLMRTGNVYVNVHTAVNPAGEIRGQVRPRG